MGFFFQIIHIPLFSRPFHLLPLRYKNTYSSCSNLTHSLDGVGLFMKTLAKSLKGGRGAEGIVNGQQRC